MPKRTNFYFSIALLTWLLVAALKRLIRFFPQPDAPINSDAYWTYLPNARKLLEHPWGFLSTDSASYHVAPLGYIWGAIWGADPLRIQIANCTLFLLSVLLMWRSATRLGGLWAGIIATGLLVYYPELPLYIPQVLTESLFLFGLLLCITSSIEYTLGRTNRHLWLGLAALGLTITLLSRPILQIFTLGAFFLAIAANYCLKYKISHNPNTVLRWQRIINGPLCLALLAALLLPAATALKNGVYFGVWGLGTGAGSGMYYGVSPFKMGLEPVYSGFRYDAGAIPLSAEPQTRGNPLTHRADIINARVATDIIKQTSLRDNLLFFTHKLKAWLLYSTPELRIAPKLRTFRIFEWLTIGMAVTTLLIRYQMSPARQKDSQRIANLYPPGNREQTLEKLGFIIFLLITTLAMAIQLTPVLYNTRYNIFFMEPWLLLLCGVSVAFLMQQPGPIGLIQKNSQPTSLATQILWLFSKIGIISVLALLSIGLTRYAQRHETLSMDPYRPGPTQIVLDRKVMGALHGLSATPIGLNSWRLDANPAVLVLPLQPPSPEALGPDYTLDAIWRIRFAISAVDTPRACRKAALKLSNAHPLQDWYRPEPELPLKVDGDMHTYAIFGNGELRPAGASDLTITFFCPVGTVVTWGGAELLKSTMPEAARELIQSGTSINPYRRSEPR